MVKPKNEKVNAINEKKMLKNRQKFWKNYLKKYTQKTVEIIDYFYVFTLAFLAKIELSLWLSLSYGRETNSDNFFTK